jgi:hypothetical protein
MSRKRRGKRKGSKVEHVCPRCSEKFYSLKKFADHIESHDWSDEIETQRNAVQVRVEAILLGVASSALWEFVKWCLANLSVEQIQRTLGNLFYLNVRLGGGRLSANRVLEMYLKDETRRDEGEQSMEEGLYQLIDEKDAKVLNEALERWMLTTTDEADI